MVFITSNSSHLRFVKYVPNALMDPKYIHSAAKHARKRGLALVGAAQTLLVQPLLPGIAMYVEPT